MLLNKIKKTAVKIVKRILISLGVIFSVILILSFTELPFWMYYYLGVNGNKLKTPPEYIILLGGGGFPSESNLIRCYYTVKRAEQFPDAKIIIALPGDITDSTSAVFLLRKELINNKIAPNRIFCENKGTNTRMQALNIKKMLADTSASILLVSSPEHMYRAVRTFEKAGMKNAGISPSFETAIDADLYFNADSLGGNKTVPDVGNNLSLRYQFWNHLKYQVIVYREYFAIAYYYFKDWI